MEINQEVANKSKKQNKIVLLFEDAWGSALVTLLYAIGIPCVLFGVVRATNVSLVRIFVNAFEQYVYAITQGMIWIVMGLGCGIVATLLKIYREIKKKNN